MKSLQQLETSYAYLFEIFPKDQINTITEKLNHDTGYSGISSPMQIQFGTKTTGGIRENRTVWDIVKPHAFIELCNKIAKEQGFGTDFSKTKESIEEISVYIIESSDLPYSILMMIIIINKQIISEKDTFKDLRGLVHSIRVYLDGFDGINSKLVTIRPSIPCLFYLGYVVPGSNLDSITKQCNELMKAYRISDLQSKMQNVVGYSDAILGIHPFNILPYDSHLLSASIQGRGLLTFTGRWEQPAMDGLNNPIIIVFTEDDQILKPMFDKIIPSGLYTRFTEIYRLEDGPTTMISLLGIRIWLQYLLKLVTEDQRFSEITHKIGEINESGDKKLLRDQLVELNRSGSSIAELSANLEEFKRTINTNLDQLSANAGILILAKNILRYVDSDYEHTSYLEKIKYSITYTLEQLSKLLEQKTKSYADFNTHVSNVVNLDNQSAVSRYALWSTFAGIASAIAAIVAIYISLTRP